MEHYVVGASESGELFIPPNNKIFCKVHLECLLVGTCSHEQHDFHMFIFRIVYRILVALETLLIRALPIFPHTLIQIYCNLIVLYSRVDLRADFPLWLHLL